MREADLLAHIGAQDPRATWDALLTVLVVALATFIEALPHLIQFGGLIVVILTAAEKLIALGWIRNPRRKPRKEHGDDPR